LGPGSGMGLSITPTSPMPFMTNAFMMAVIGSPPCSVGHQEKSK
jgi:hypothetical protein